MKAINSISVYDTGFTLGLSTSQNRHVPLTIGDDAVIVRVAKGDSESFGILVRKYENFVFTMAKCLIHSEESAKDITQETFIRAFLGLRLFESRSSFKTWIYRIVYNLSINYLKKNKTPLPSGDIIDDESFNVGSGDIETQACLRKLIDKLKPEYKAIVLLYYFDDLTYEEIAEVMSCPLGTVKIRLFRAKCELRKLWDRHAVKL